MARSTNTGGSGKSKKNRKHNRNRKKCEAYAARRKKAIQNGSPLTHKERRKARS
jgi:hypothetical protein